MLPFVPQSFTGVSDQQFEIPYDLVAGNGSSRLIILDYHTTSGVNVTVDGERIDRLRLGGNAKIEIGNQICTMELMVEKVQESGPDANNLSCRL